MRLWGAHVSFRGAEPSIAPLYFKPWWQQQLNKWKDTSSGNRTGTEHCGTQFCWKKKKTQVPNWMKSFLKLQKKTVNMVIIFMQHGEKLELYLYFSVLQPKSTDFILWLMHVCLLTEILEQIDCPRNLVKVWLPTWLGSPHHSSLDHVLSHRVVQRVSPTRSINHCK